MSSKVLTGCVSLAISLLGAISMDYNKWLKYREKHPGAKYDFAVMFGTVLNSLYVGLPGALGISALTPEN